MRRNPFFVIAAIFCFAVFARFNCTAQQRPSTYDQVDEVRNLLKLDHSQFEKVYSAYDKYNKAVFGDQSKAGMPAPPSGGRPGGPMGPPPGSDRRPEGGRPDGNFRPGDGAPGIGVNPPDKSDIEKNEKKRAKQEAKLAKSMQKIFKDDPGAFAAWQKIREDQLKRMAPGHGPRDHRQMHNNQPINQPK